MLFFSLVSQFSAAAKISYLSKIFYLQNSVLADHFNWSFQGFLSFSKFSNEQVLLTFSNYLGDKNGKLEEIPLGDPEAISSSEGKSKWRDKIVEEMLRRKRRAFSLSPRCFSHRFDFLFIGTINIRPIPRWGKGIHRMMMKNYIRLSKNASSHEPMINCLWGCSSAMLTKYTRPRWTGAAVWLTTNQCFWQLQFCRPHVDVKFSCQNLLGISFGEQSFFFPDKDHILEWTGGQNVQNKLLFSFVFSNKNLSTWPKQDIVLLNCKKGLQRQFVFQRQLVRYLRPR